MVLWQKERIPCGRSSRLTLTRLRHLHEGTGGMGFRLYKAVRLGKGVRLNLSKTGIGVSAGVPGARYSVHSSGRTAKTMGVPGTGVYYRKDTYAKGGRSHPGSLSPTPVPRAYPKAGLLAPKAEKEFVQGVTAYMQERYSEALVALQSAEDRDAGEAHIGEEFFAALSLVALDRVPRGDPILRSGARL